MFLSWIYALFALPKCTIIPNFEVCNFRGLGQSAKTAKMICIGTFMGCNNSFELFGLLMQISTAGQEIAKQLESLRYTV